MSAESVEDGNEIDVTKMLEVTLIVPLDLLERPIEVRDVNGVVLFLFLQQEVQLRQGDLMIFQRHCPESRDVIRMSHHRSRCLSTLPFAVTIVKGQSRWLRSTGSDDIFASFPESPILLITLPGANSLILESLRHLARMILPNLIPTPLHTEVL